MSEIKIGGKPIEGYFEDALNDPEVPKIYANGFSNGLGTGDVTIVFQLSQKPVAVVNVSFTVAKTLAQKINSMILSLENDTGNTIMTTDEIAKAGGFTPPKEDK